MTPPRRILILTAGFGEGHNAAARALLQAFEENEPGSAVMVDLFAVAKPRLNRLFRWGYLTMINGLPKLWSRVYQWMDKSEYLPKWACSQAAERNALIRILREEEPRVIVCTFPIYAFMLQKLRTEGRRIAPFYNVVTDSISINSLWFRAPCEGWFLPNEDSAQVLRQAGIDDSRLHVSGFPVNLFFSKHPELAPPPLAQGASPKVLYIINSGTANAETMARLLLAESAWEITCAVGRDESLKQHLEALAERRAKPATILGWTDQIPQLLMTHHVVISKAGGATTQEAIAACCPMIVNQIVPGQEEGNYELLRRHNAGVLATNPDLVISALRRAFDWDGRVWHEWRAAMTSLTRPEAARAIAAKVLAGPLDVPQARATEVLS